LKSGVGDCLHGDGGDALWVLACLAIAANWSHTLGAIVHRTAGTEAESAKTSAAIADARDELARIGAERKALPAFVPATADDVTAARAAVKAAEDSRKAECEARGKHCRAREETEQQKHAALATTLVNMAATDRAAKLDADAAAIRAQLAQAPAVKDTNPLGNALARLLPMLPAASAATYQQAVISLIAELLIAAGLAPPELLRREPHRNAATASPAAGTRVAGPMAPEKAVARPGANLAASRGVKVVSLDGTRPSGDVGQFATACLVPRAGKSLDAEDAVTAYTSWCRAQGTRPLGADEFVTEFAALLKFAGVRTTKVRGRLRCMDMEATA
jgi:hypothetical protein